MKFVICWTSPPPSPLKAAGGSLSATATGHFVFQDVVKIYNLRTGKGKLVGTVLYLPPLGGIEMSLSRIFIQEPFLLLFFACVQTTAVEEF